MPAGVMKEASGAPISSCGITGTPGQRLAASAVMGCMIACVSGGATLAWLCAAWVVIVISGSPANAASLPRIVSALVPGKMRQLTLALTCWGRALVAWPPLIKVTTQVVRMAALYLGSVASTDDAWASPGSRANAAMAWPIAPGVSGAMRAKYSREASV